ncbi:hypothetical protein BGZ61DRAFT_168026 [Ilyonectria robusta]|uniref:uncharacterized protein n=1 Tax=Ilyonectria robusta TaxID=1079257 RepID=UPI001E8EA67D|nr:uncharacterized protein BGZ61DRAFT_168026 [Ilyonectria robusta]KAH8733922.1 hypothetical protein BGZ61DRAFT_168026 [Ilyonectria robusta]
MYEYGSSCIAPLPSTASPARPVCVRLSLRGRRWMARRRGRGGEAGLAAGRWPLAHGNAVTTHAPTRRTPACFFFFSSSFRFGFWLQRGDDNVVCCTTAPSALCVALAGWLGCLAAASWLDGVYSARTHAHRARALSAPAVTVTDERHRVEGRLALRCKIIPPSLGNGNGGGERRSR